MFTVTAMLTRMLAALFVVLGLGVLTAWAWDCSDANHRAAMAAAHTHAGTPAQAVAPADAH